VTVDEDRLWHDGYEAGIRDGRREMQPRVDRLRRALVPFAAFVRDARPPPVDFVITTGSPMARRQLTIGDCLEALAALRETET